MNFRVLRGCRRSAEEQRYIWAALEIWNRLPAQSREAARELIASISRTAPEGRALFDVLARGISPQAVCARTGVQLSRLYQMRCEFYNRFWP